MKHKEGMLSGRDGVKLYFQYWLPDNEVKAVILLSHGATEHSGRYNHLAMYFTKRGYLVAALDHYGHGQSDGGKGHLRKFEDYLNGLHALHQQVAQNYPNTPLFLIGHSMGGLIASHYLLTHQSEINACVLSGPAIMSEVTPPHFQMLLIKLISKLAPNLGMLQIDADGISRDPEIILRAKRDPLINSGKISARMIDELFTAMDVIQKRAKEIKLPILLLHGGDDTITSPQGSKFLKDAVSSNKSELHIFPGLYHEIFNEPEHLEVFAKVDDWLEVQLAD